MTALSLESNDVEKQKSKYSPGAVPIDYLQNNLNRVLQNWKCIFIFLIAVVFIVLIVVLTVTFTRRSHGHFADDNLNDTKTKSSTLNSGGLDSSTIPVAPVEKYYPKPINDTEDRSELDKEYHGEENGNGNIHGTRVSNETVPEKNLSGDHVQSKDTPVTDGTTLASNQKDRVKETITTDSSATNLSGNHVRGKDTPTTHSFGTNDVSSGNRDRVRDIDRSTNMYGTRYFPFGTQMTLPTTEETPKTTTVKNWLSPLDDDDDDDDDEDGFFHRMSSTFRLLRKSISNFFSNFHFNWFWT